MEELFGRTKPDSVEIEPTAIGSHVGRMTYGVLPFAAMLNKLTSVSSAIYVIIAIFYLNKMQRKLNKNENDIEKKIRVSK